MKVFLDDERLMPEGWHRVYWPVEAMRLLETGQVTELSLDHDLGDDEIGIRTIEMHARKGRGQFFP